VFYSISNTQKGLAGVSFGHFLIKQVAEDLKRDLPNLRTFVTLSPVPGFAGWLERERAEPVSRYLTEEDRTVLQALDDPNWAFDPVPAEAVRKVLIGAAASYFLRAKTPRGKPIDPVARFHLGNGARLERLNFLGDPSPKGMKQSFGLMVNYLYDLDDIERNHEAFAEKGEVIASPGVRRLLRADLPARDLVTAS
jgi:malonyl-CoA decarboxylase